MKYIKTRDRFLTGIQEYKDNTNYQGLQKINEEAPLENDIAWGDSLLGRLIHHVIRKAKIRFNLMRIKGVARKLRQAMDDLLEGSKPATLEGEDKKQFERVQVFSFLQELDKAIQLGYKVGIIKNLTDSAIQNISSIDEFDGKKTLIAQLEEFKKFLEQFKDDIGAEDPELKGEEGLEGETEEGDEESEDEGDKDDDKSKETGKDSATQTMTMVDNLKSLALILTYYKNIKIGGGVNTAGGTKVTYKTVEGDTITKIQANPKANPKKLQIKDIRNKNSKLLTAYPKDTDVLKPGLTLIMENLGFISFLEAIGEGGGKDRGNIKAGEDYLTQAFTKLKKDLEVLESEKEKGIAVTTKFINEITANYKEPKNREAIKSLYSEVNRYLVGDKKSTIQEKDKLYKESLDIISDKNKKVIVAEKIARFAKRALQFEGEGFYGGLGDLGKPLEKFVNTMKVIMTYNLSSETNSGDSMEKKESKFKVGDTVNWTNKEGKKISNKIKKVENGEYFFQTEDGQEFSKKEDELKKESNLLRYSKFIKLINEADEPVAQDNNEEGKVSGPERPNALTKIKDFWQKNVDFKQYVIDKTQYDKIEKNLAKKMQDNKDAVVLTMDPVLEIVKCFNRAYKLHTTQVIPTARSSGKVSNAKFLEYQSFGGGSQESAGVSGGPYRNIKIFNEWEDAVQTIMGDKKYQKIFAKGTRLNNGGRMIENAGSNLRKFMDDMLDGEELYKSKDGKGAQSKFLDKYFGYKEGDDASKTHEGGEEERQEISTNATDVAKATKEVKFVEDSIPFSSPEELVGTFFSISSADSYSAKQNYFFIQSYSSGQFYVTYTIGFPFFRDIIHTHGGVGAPTLKNIKGELKITMPEGYTSGEDQYVIKATRIPSSLFDPKTGKLKKGKFFSSYVQKKKLKDKGFDNSVSEVETIKDEDQFRSNYYLTLAVLEGESSTEPKRLKLKNSYVQSSRGGFANIKSTKGIEDVRFRSE